MNNPQTLYPFFVSPFEGEPVILYDRTIENGGSSLPAEFDSLNLIFVVLFAVGISFLAQWISRRGRRK